MGGQPRSLFQNGGGYNQEQTGNLDKLCWLPTAYLSGFSLLIYIDFLGP